MGTEEVLGTAILASIDGLLYLLFRSLRRSAEAEVASLRNCSFVSEGESLHRALKGAKSNEVDPVAFSGVLAPQAEKEVMALDGERCIAFKERHDQVRKDGHLVRTLLSEKRVPHMLARRQVQPSRWTLGMGASSEECVLLTDVQSASGFGGLFRRRRERRVPLPSSSSSGRGRLRGGDGGEHYLQMVESYIPAGLTLNFLGALTYDPISKQLYLRVANVGFASLQELAESASSRVNALTSAEKFFLYTTLALAGLGAFRAFWTRRRTTTPPPPPPPRRPHESGFGTDAEGSLCGVCYCRQPRTVLVDCGHALCSVCADAVGKCPFCGKPKLSLPMQIFVP